MRLAMIAAGLALIWAVPVRAEADVACTALGALVEYGMVDGGIGGDTAAVSAVVAAGDPVACTAWLDEYGYGAAGLSFPECAEVIAQVSDPALPEALWPTAPALIETALTSDAPDLCAQHLVMLAE